MVHELPGRVRFFVPALRNSEQVRDRLETGLRRAPGVFGAQASPLTGRLLVHFDRGIGSEALSGLIADLLATEPGRASSAEPGWHGLAPESIVQQLDTSLAHGLSPQEAHKRIGIFGRNQLPRPELRSGASILKGQLTNLPSLLLGAAALFSLATGALLEGAAILSAVALNAGIGYVTESRAERVIKSLGDFAEQDPQVVRGGETVKVAPDDLVPGDVLLLRRGMMIAADARIVSATDLSIAEAALTGESAPVAKASEPVLGSDVRLADRINMAYRGTFVTAGSGQAVVVATGRSTEVGRVQELVNAAAPPDTPMQKQLDGLGRQIAWLALGVSGAMLGLGWLRGFAFLQVFRSAVALAVGAVPEGLPTVATTALALGVHDMRRRNVLVRRIDAAETLAATTLVCFDKTGTLTTNQMQVASLVCGSHSIRPAAERSLDPMVRALLETGTLCSQVECFLQADGSIGLSGSGTETAIVRAALESGIDILALQRDLPKTEVRQRAARARFMVTVHEAEDVSVVAVKGSPGDVLDLCMHEAAAGGMVLPLSASRRAAIMRINTDMAAHGQRVLGVARRELATTEPATYHGLTWLGLVGLSDPIRHGTERVIQGLHRAGLRTVIITGDQSATAAAIARDLGFAGESDPVVIELGPDRLPEPELLRRAHAFARVTPEQKLLLVRALQQAGEIVAMVGDGINDGPALRAADVGVALGRGTSAARNIADIILETDDLSALLAAIERGRTTFINIRKAVRYLLGTNLSEVLVMLAGAAVGVQQPLTPMQLLWINLVSDTLPGIALCLEPSPPGIMQEPPRAGSEPILGPADMGRLTTEAVSLGSGAMAACLYGCLRYGSNSPRTSTMTFGSLVASQLLHSLTVRSKTSMLGPAKAPSNSWLSAVLLLSSVMQGAAVAIPGLRRLLGLAPLGPMDLVVTAAGGVLPFFMQELGKRGAELTAATQRGP